MPRDETSAIGWREPDQTPSTAQIDDDLWLHGSTDLEIPLTAAGGQQWSIAICGDWAPQPGAQQAALMGDPEAFYGELLEVLQSTDATCINLECPLVAEPGRPIVKDGPPMAAPADLVAGLVAPRVTFACLANNHILDFGPDGLGQTLDTLRRHGIATVGAGLSTEEAERPLIVKVGRIQLAVLNAAEGEEARSSGGAAGAAGLHLGRLKSQISRLRSSADVVIVIAHAGREFLPVPPPHVRLAYHRLIDAGADLVVGHHPHVVQGLERYRAGLIAYSLGNFAFDMDGASDHCRQGFVLEVGFRGSHPARISIWPYEIQPERLRPLTGNARSAFLKHLQALSSIVSDSQRADEVWNAYADRWLTSVGLQELAESVALIGGSSIAFRAGLQALSRRYTGDHLTHRLARRAIWKAIHLIEHRRRAGQVASTTLSRPDAATGAAVLRNRFDTDSHRELYLTALRRLMDGQQGTAPTWAQSLLDDQQVFWWQAPAQQGLHVEGVHPSSAHGGEPAVLLHDRSRV